MLADVGLGTPVATRLAAAFNELARAVTITAVNAIPLKPALMDDLQVLEDALIFLIRSCASILRHP